MADSSFVCMLTRCIARDRSAFKWVTMFLVRTDKQIPFDDAVYGVASSCRRRRCGDTPGGDDLRKGKCVVGF